MISFAVRNNGLTFSSTYNNSPLHFNEWSTTDDCIYYYPLSTLIDNGNASFEANTCTVPFESVYLLDEADRQVLGIPTVFDKDICLRADGTMNTSAFKYDILLLSHFPDGELLPFTRQGNIVHVGCRDFLLTEPQWQLFDEVERFNASDESLKTIDFNLRTFAKIKHLALQAACHLDSYLANENVFSPDTIKLEVWRDDNNFTILPTVDIADKEKFTSAFDRLRQVRNVYPVQHENGERTRVVLNREQTNALNVLKERQCRFQSREEIQDIIEHPTAYFDPEQFDLSEFYSDRVIEIGVYKPRFNAFVSSYKSQWITAATVETPSNGTTLFKITTYDELDELSLAIDEARRMNKNVVNYQGTYIDIEDACYLYKIATKQLASPNAPIKEAPVKKVLIIEENEDKLGYNPEREELGTASHYTLFANGRLDKQFTLKEHQKEGIAWLQHLHSRQATGCLMADDMGLGKTLQILYFIDWHSQTHPDHKPYLIVAPISLLENWETEYKRFFPTSTMHITRLTSHNLPRKFDSAAINAIQHTDLLLTNYDTLRIAQLNLCAVQFEVVVLDEAQNIKTIGTMRTSAAKALRANFKIAMTGTPVENSLLDLWSIMDFCVPGLLGNAKTFKARYKTSRHNNDADIMAMGKALHSELGIYLMRRMKSNVAQELPAKHEVKRPTIMPPLQVETYQKVINEYHHNKEHKEHNILVTIQQLRAVSEHPYLYDGTMAIRPIDSLMVDSARVCATMEALDQIALLREKAIVFVERKESQRMLQKLFHQRYGIISKIINGDTPALANKGDGKQSRQCAIDEFQSREGFNIIIMSPIAAGMGLNVTKANHVIHFSRHWNPAKESQATDRVYRIGQTKDVYVYYPMAVSNQFKSFDVTLDELLKRKDTLATSTIFPTEKVEVRPDELGQMLLQ